MNTPEPASQNYLGAGAVVCDTMSLRHDGYKRTEPLPSPGSERPVCEATTEDGDRCTLKADYAVQWVDSSGEASGEAYLCGTHARMDDRVQEAVPDYRDNPVVMTDGGTDVHAPKNVLGTRLRGHGVSRRFQTELAKIDGVNGVRPSASGNLISVWLDVDRTAKNQVKELVKASDFEYDQPFGFPMISNPVGTSEPEIGFELYYKP